ncbi:glycosyltransferase family 4 protein [Thalassospira sp. HF15]|uniref:glycosyltransferase family 4 protein n=1 Tax=Thalassospira sp. HF15 TaxID=2722755 RepID=UPI0014308960|nr:glycosyltransferase family 4 protein [Thalassospira sp. HF15]
MIVLPGEARESRLSGARSGRNPKEFFYGGLALQEQGHEVVFLNARQMSNNMAGRFRQHCERKLNGLTQIGVTRSQVELMIPHLHDVDVVFGFTDSFSLSMGCYRSLLPKQLKVIGGFHGLADWRKRVRPPFRSGFGQLVRSSLQRLDYAMTSGAADREAATKEYALPAGLLQSYDFGVDQDFWSPGGTTAQKNDNTFFLAIGSDPQRDYSVIARAVLSVQVKVITNIDEPGLQQNPKIELVRGSLATSHLSDEDIRELYRACRGVIVPIKDVWQPSGCSVTLQAMSCGKPVIITDYKGLFDREFLRDGENCVLVPPRDPIALQQAIDRLSHDEAFYSGISEGALRTAREHFGISRLENTISTLVDRIGVKD